MWLEAIVSVADFRALVLDLLPLTIHLGESTSGHYLQLTRPAEVSLLEDRGLLVTCRAEVHWPVLGVEVPIQIEPLAVLVTPSISANGDALLVSPRVESADVAWVPAILDARIVEALNAALDAKSAELAWLFTTTLGHQFALPTFLQPLYALDLTVAWGKVRTTTEAMVLAISFHARGVGQAERALDPAPPAALRAGGDLSRGKLALRAPARTISRGAFAAGAGLAFLAFFALGSAYRALSGRHSRGLRAFR